MIEIVPATRAHAAAIELRPGDAREVAAFGQTMPGAFDLATSRGLWAEAYLIDGEVAALVGLSVGNLLAGVGCPWLLTGRPVDRHKKLFLQRTRAGLARMRAEFPSLVSWIHAPYVEALRWACWLGFEIEAPQPHGPLGEPFCRISIAGGS